MMTRREKMLKRAAKETAKGIAAIFLFVVCIIAVVELYMGDFYSVYDSHMQIIWSRKIIRWLMYDGIFAVMVVSCLAIRACFHRAWFDCKQILSDD